MRKVHIANGKFYLNNEPYFQRLVMNQGIILMESGLHLPMKP